MPLRRFLSELKRRQVYHAVIVYLTVAWVLLEAADIVFPRLGFEDWTVNLVLTLAAAGFPIALVLAWIFDISPEGISRTPPLSPGANHHFSWARIAEFVVVGMLVVALGYLYVDRLSLQERLVQQETAVTRTPGEQLPGEIHPEQYRAIAVLPFADMSEAGDQAWFAEGIAEELLIALSKVDELDVVARTSAFAFRGTGKTIAEIADTLGVQAVLEGSVRRSGERVRITAQLIDASDGYQVWSGSYERELANIFKLQDEIARAIVKALRVELKAGATGTLVAEQTGKMEAYNALIRGRALLDWGSPQNLVQGISYLEKAVAADPEYSQAWGFLAWARSSAFFWQATTKPAIQSATAAYERALELDPGQSEALAAKAWMTQLLDWDWETANDFYLQAMASGENTTAMLAYGMYYLWAIDRPREAVRVLRLVQQRDPLHPGYIATLAYSLLVSGDAEAAILAAREALELKPEHAFALISLIDAHIALGDISAALAVLENLPDSLRLHPRLRLRSAFCNVAQGDLDSARIIYRTLMDDPIPYGNILVARLALMLGETDQAVDLMEREVEQHSWNSLFIRMLFKHNDAIKDNPRYLALLKQIGLDDESVAELHRKLLFD